MRGWRAISGLSCLLVSCASPPPYEDYTLARTALKAAQEAEAAQFAPSFFSDAQNHYQLGEKTYKENDFDAAKQNFLECIKAAERAENTTRIKKLLTGGGGP